ncbi:MAG: MerR family transcriptional regulator [Myxococcota bacterium]|nr:MerR family transcriptional regulator [Myxococcota bacterium]
MTTSTDAYSLSEICTLTGVTQRTVRYYIQQGLLPTASRSGPNVVYPEAFLLRLRLIARLKSEHLPLAHIREQLVSISDDEVSALVSTPSPPPADTAADYVRALLRPDENSSPPHVPTSSPGSPTPNTVGFMGQSRWDRVSLSPDVELHIRRPLTREDNARVQRLMRHAKRIFES